MSAAAPGPIAIVGGVYRERCLSPSWLEIYGSAGRAASALARMGVAVELHSCMATQEAAVMESRAALEGFGLHSAPSRGSVTFVYDHGLATPTINRVGATASALRVTATHAVRFGTLDSDWIVEADMAVYDPQDANHPATFAANGSTARRLALVLNRREASLLTGMDDAPVEEMAAALIADDSVEAVVIKQGPLGAFVCDRTSSQVVPAFRTSNVWKIGSGDNFVAHFAYRWMTEGRSPAESAALASTATAFYCQTSGFASPSTLATFSPQPVRASSQFLAGRKPSVYLAGPFFSLGQLWVVEQARQSLLAMGLLVRSPYHDIGHGSADDVVSLDLAALDASDVVLAIVDGLDAGTIFEIGHARAKGKPVIVYSEREGAADLKMMQGTQCILRTDLVTALYETLWTACEL